MTQFMTFEQLQRQVQILLAELETGKCRKMIYDSRGMLVKCDCHRQMVKPKLEEVLRCKYCDGIIIDMHCECPHKHYSALKARSE